MLIVVVAAPVLAIIIIDMDNGRGREGGESAKRQAVCGERFRQVCAIAHRYAVVKVTLR